MNEKDVKEFWDAHPCGEESVGGINEDYEEFFNRYDAFRYKQHRHLLKCLDAIDFRDKQVLDVGLGLGADSEQIIRRSAVWNGVDLTPASVERVGKRLSLRNLPYKRLEVGSVCNLPFDNDYFDIVYAHGSLMCVPEIEKAQAEIWRVLKHGGQLIAMLYAKSSLNYWGSIFLLRRVALFLIYLAGVEPKGIAGQHVKNARKMGLIRYLHMKNFIHYNTDGPLNPYIRVHTIKDVRREFPDFRIVKNYKRFMWAPPLPVSWMPFEKFMGWHLWVHLEPRK